MERSATAIFGATEDCDANDHFVRTDFIADHGPYGTPTRSVDEVAPHALEMTSTSAMLNQATLSRDCTVAPRTAAMTFDERLLDAVRDEKAHNRRDTGDDSDPKGDCTFPPRTTAMNFDGRLLDAVRDDRAQEKRDCFDDSDYEGGYTDAPRTAAMGFDERLLETVRDEGAHDGYESWDDSDHEGRYTFGSPGERLANMWCESNRSTFAEAHAHELASLAPAWPPRPRTCEGSLDDGAAQLEAAFRTGNGPPEDFDVLGSWACREEGVAAQRKDVTEARLSVSRFRSQPTPRAATSASAVTGLRWLRQRASASIDEIRQRSLASEHAGRTSAEPGGAVCISKDGYPLCRTTKPRCRPACFSSVPVRPGEEDRWNGTIRAPSTPAPSRHVRRCYLDSEKSQSSGQHTAEGKTSALNDDTFESNTSISVSSQGRPILNPCDFESNASTVAPEAGEHKAVRHIQASGEASSAAARRFLDPSDFGSQTTRDAEPAYAGSSDVQYVHCGIKAPQQRPKSARPSCRQSTPRQAVRAGAAAPQDIMVLAGDCYLLKQKPSTARGHSHAPSPIVTSRSSLPPIARNPRRDPY